MFTMDIGEAPRAASGAVNEDEAGHAKLEDMVTSKPTIPILTIMQTLSNNYPFHFIPDP